MTSLLRKLSPLYWLEKTFDQFTYTFASLRNEPKGMAYVEDGDFEMGAIKFDEFAAEDEKPSHDVYVSPFFADRYEFKNGDVERVWINVPEDLAVSLVPCNYNSPEQAIRGKEQAEDAWQKKESIVDYVKICGMRPPRMAPAIDKPESPSGFNRDDQPLTNVTWKQAAALCEADGKRLPTEAEWELMAKAGKNCKYGVAECNSLETGASRVCRPEDKGFEKCETWNRSLARYSAESTSVINIYKPNEFGLYGMSGNVMEWVSDWYGAYEPSYDVVENPKGPEKGDQKIVRGGAYNSTEKKDLRTTARTPADPASHTNYVGFRCVKSI